MDAIRSKADIAAALQKAAEEAGWSPARIAATVGRSEQAARAWLKGDSEMGASAYQKLRVELPGFADLVDTAQVA